jgi:sec-independent protein translocase protein TatB
MFDIGSSELLMIVIVAVVVIGPKDLPRALYKVGQLVGKARALSRHFRSGIDAMMREVEMEEMEKKWAAENRRIMEQYPDAEREMEALPAPAEPAIEPAQPEPKPAKGKKAQAQASLPLGDGAAEKGT